jgi:threonine aldolase
LADIHEAAVDPATVETNMVYLDLRPFNKRAPEVSAALLERGVVTLALAGPLMRLVTHRDVDAADIEVALDALRDTLTET